MEHHLFTVAGNWLVNIVFGIVALVIALLAIGLCDKVLFRQIDFIEEVSKGNVAAAIGFAAMLGFAAYIIGSSVS